MVCSSAGGIRYLVHLIKEKEMAEKKNILAIDDDPMVLRVLTALLTPVYDLRISRSAADAMALMDQLKPDIILLDIEMPNISGFEFLHTIKKNPKFMGIPVVVVSGHYETEFVIHAEHSGASAVVAKPINQEDLIKKIDFAFENPRKNIFGL